MNLYSDIETYVRRIVKSPSNAVLSSSLIADYVNRFWLMDMSARMQLFDLKTVYKFETIPGISDYVTPLYLPQASTSAQNNLQSTITPFPVYQGFMSPVRCNGIEMGFMTEKDSFYRGFPDYTQSLFTAATGTGGMGPYTFTLPYFPAIPGVVDLSGLLAANQSTSPIFTNTLVNVPPQNVYPRVYFTYTTGNGNTETVCDSGQFLLTNATGELYGLLMRQGQAGGMNTALDGSYSTTTNTINYMTGRVNIKFPNAVPAGADIQAQCVYFQQGRPTGMLFYNNIISLFPPPNTQYLMELTAYMTPAAFLASSQAIPFAYMAEYIARGAARKILSDTGDMEQFMFYEPLFREQELLVWKRSGRQNTTTRSPTIYSGPSIQTPYSTGQGAT